MVGNEEKGHTHTHTHTHTHKYAEQVCFLEEHSEIFTVNLSMAILFCAPKLWVLTIPDNLKLGSLRTIIKEASTLAVDLSRNLPY